MAFPEFMRNFDWQLLSHYIVALMVLPIMVLTVRNVVKNSATLFDSDLTANDRALLKQFALFLLLPLVALFHEMGHALVGHAECGHGHVDIDPERRADVERGIGCVKHRGV